MLTAGRRHLERWKARAKRRQERLKRALAQPVHSLGAVRRSRWLGRFRMRLATRRAWLEARLGHLEELEQLVNLNTASPNTVAHRKPSPVRNVGVVTPVVKPVARPAPTKRQKQK